MSVFHRACTSALMGCMVSVAWAQVLNLSGEICNPDVDEVSDVPMARVAAAYNVPTQSSYPMIPSEPVDLGLSVKWASYNVGASTPLENGYYFAWGQTQGYPADHCFYSSDWSSTVDGGWSGKARYDAATANWGSDWRTPTQEEITELITYCGHSFTSINGVEGVLFTGPNGNTVFFPAAKHCDSNGYNDCGGYAVGKYWSDTKDYQSLYYLLFSNNPNSLHKNEPICYKYSMWETGWQGYSVRAVYDGPDDILSTNLSDFITIDGQVNSVSVTNNSLQPWTVNTATGIIQSSQNVGQGQTGSFSITVDVPRESTVSFDVKSNCSEEVNVMRVLLDGECQFEQSGTGNSWTTERYDLSPGEHTLTFSYIKRSFGKSFDTNYVRNIKINVSDLSTTGFLDWINIDGQVNSCEIDNTGTYPWKVDLSTGIMQSSNQGANGSTSSFSFNVDVPMASTVTFDIKSSSEDGYDFMEVWLDGTRQLSQSGTDHDWTTQQYTLSPGEHTLTFSYNKDGNRDRGDDTGYVRNISIYVAEINTDLSGWIIFNVPVNSYSVDNDVSYPWEVNTVTGVMQSGNKGVANSTSNFSITVDATTMSTVSFDVVSRTGSGNYMKVYLDDIRQFPHGETNFYWVNEQYILSPGVHTLTFSYSKDFYKDGDNGMGYVKNIVFNELNPKPSLSGGVTVKCDVNSCSVANDRAYPWTFNPSTGVLQSGYQIPEGSTSSFSITVDVVSESAVSFDAKMNGLMGEDNLEMFIDGERQFSRVGTENRWITKQLPLSPGVHTLTFVYSRGASMDVVNDFGYLRNIVIKEPEYSVASNDWITVHGEPKYLSLENSDSNPWTFDANTGIIQSEPGASSSFCITVEVPTQSTVTFDVCSAYGDDSDYLTMTLDGESKLIQYGSDGYSWSTKRYTLSPGEHKLRFWYYQLSPGNGSENRTDGRGYVRNIVINIPGQNDSLSEWISVNCPTNSFSVNNNGYYPWIVDTSTGTIQSNNQGLHSSTASFSIDVDLPTATAVSFEAKSSSQIDHDNIRVYLNGLCKFEQSGTDNDWTFQQYILYPGRYNLIFSYSKDGNTSDGQDIGLVRNIVFDQLKPNTDLSDYITVNCPVNSFSIDNDGPYPWEVDYITEIISSGNKELDSTTSSFSIFVDVPQESTVTFDFNTSCQRYYDYMEVLLDDVRQISQSGTGNVWSTRQYTLSPGEHTLTFSYSKNGSYSTGDDAAFVKNIVFDVVEPVSYDLASMMTWEKPVVLDINNAGSYPWYVGDECLISGNKYTPDTQSYFEVKPTTPDGRGINVAFDWYVSCDSSGDYFFYDIDGFGPGFHGIDNGWEHVELHIDSGQTLRIGYRKDNVGDAGEDRAKVANLTFIPDPALFDVALELVSTALYTDRVNLVPIRLSSTEDVVATQFDITLPSGLSFDHDDGEYYIVRGECLDGTHEFDVCMIGSSLHIDGYSTDNHTYLDNDGCLIYLPVVVDSGVEVGSSFEIRLSQGNVTIENGLQKIDVAEQCILINVEESGIQGDANGDGDVTVTDITYIVAYIIGDSPDDLVFAGGDANGDGDISVTDISCVVAIIHNGHSSSITPQHAPWHVTGALTPGIYIEVKGDTARKVSYK